MAIDIHIAKNDADYTAFGALVREYADWCRARFAHEAWMIELAFSHQSLDSELESLAARYGPPDGKTFLARATAQSSAAALTAGDRMNTAR